MSDQPQVIVAGHICLDLIPTFQGEQGRSLASYLAPGQLVEVGPAVTATGGPVSNTGLSLHRLGIPTALMGKVGDDLLGGAVLDLLRTLDPTLAEGMIVGQGETTSYSVVLSPPGIDRVFFHSAGANHTFGAADIDASKLAGARFFHLGYPPLMRRMYAEGGRELAAIFAQAKAAGLTTSLDMAYPDPKGESGQVDWAAVLQTALPHVDVCLPSLDETLFMLDRPRFDALGASGDALARRVDAVLLGSLADRLLSMGAAVAALKLGDQGLYVKTTADRDRLTAMGACAPADVENWAGRELLAPIFQTPVVGTTGAGDATIAGFIVGMLEGRRLEEVMIGAVAVGAFNVEQPDATSGIPPWDVVQARIPGWQQAQPAFGLGQGWRYDDAFRLWLRR